METASSRRWKILFVFPLALLLVAIVGGCLAFGGTALLRFLVRPVALPFWCVALLSLGSVAFVAGGIFLLWRRGQRPVEMERRPLIVNGVRWRWWTGLSGSLRVVPYCEACDLQLRPREGPADSTDTPAGFALHCENCRLDAINFQGPLDHAPQLILDYFMQNLRKEFELFHPGH